MEFAHYWSIIIKRWILVIISVIAVGSGTFFGSKFLTPLYQSTALVQIAISTGSTQADYNNLLASDQLVQTEALLAVSDPVLREVASHHPGLTVDQLLKEVTSTPKLNTQLFEIDVIDPSPTMAATLANDIAATLIKQQLQVTQQSNIQAQQQIQQDLADTRLQINTTANQLAALQANVQTSTKNQAQIAVLKAQLNGLQQHYNQWQTVLAQLELTEAQSSNSLRIVQLAQPGLKPVRPNLLLNTGAGLLAGLLLGILLAVVIEQLDKRVRTSEELTRLLSWPALATIWLARPSKKEAVIHPTGRNINVEAYRILRTNIGFSAVDKPLRTLVVTSATPRDGKSVIATNLAIFMAKAGKNTLLIDADLRRPTLHEKFAIPAYTKGLSNAILAFSMPTAVHAPAQESFPSVTASDVPSSVSSASKKESLDPYMYAVEVPNLCVMPSGPLPPNPSELLDSKAMQRFFTALSNCGAEVVIFDSPPLIGLSDANLLASKADGTLVVVDITHANKKNLKQVKTLLEQAGARILGCVVNKHNHGRKDSIYSYYYSTDKQNGTGSHDTNDVNTLDFSLVTPDILRQPEAQSQSDLLDERRGG